MVTRKGLGLAEAAVAVALFALLGIAIWSVLSSGARGAVRAGETELAATMGARVMDRMLTGGYAYLASRADGEGELRLDEPFRARYRLERTGEGLVKVVLTLTWQRRGETAGSADGSMRLIRLVADPLAAERARAPFQ